MKHANIVTLHDTVHTPNALTLVFEFLVRILKECKVWETQKVQFDLLGGGEVMDVALHDSVHTQSALTFVFELLVSIIKGCNLKGTWRDLSVGGGRVDKIAVV